MVKIEDLDDEQLAATAYVWRRRAQAGEKNAHQTWDRMEQELRRRLGPTPSDYAPLKAERPEQRPRWQFWRGIRQLLSVKTQLAEILPLTKIPPRL